MNYNCYTNEGEKNMNIIKGKKKAGVETSADYRRVYRLTTRGVVAKGRKKNGEVKWEKRASFVDYAMSKKPIMAYLNMMVMLGVMNEEGKLSKKVTAMPPLGSIIIDKVEITYYNDEGKAYDCTVSNMPELGGRKGDELAF